MRRAVATVVLIWLPLWALPAGIYRSIDPQGHVRYSDTPSPGAQLITVTDAQSDNTPADNAPPGSAKNDPPPKQDEQINQQLAQQAAARAVQQDTSQVRAKQCKQAQDNYQQSIDARRIYKTGADGERQYLTDDEADQQRVNNRLAMEAACKTAP